MLIFQKNYRLIAVDLSKQKALDSDSRAIQPITFTGTIKTTAKIHYIIEQSKEIILKFSERTFWSLNTVKKMQN